MVSKRYSKLSWVLLWICRLKILERVIYFDAYMVVHQGHSPYPRKTLLSNAEYENYIDAHPDDTEFVAEIGAEAIRTVLSYA